MGVEISNGFVCLMGMGVVFIGLICLVFICYLLRLCCGKRAEQAAAPAQTEAAPASAVIENREELIAAVSAAIAEELGSDASGIRIHSFKRV